MNIRFYFEPATTDGSSTFFLIPSPLINISNYGYTFAIMFLNCQVGMHISFGNAQ